MNGPRPVNVIAFGLLGLFLAGVGLTAVMKLRAGKDHADREEERRPRSLNVDQTLPDWLRNLDRNTDSKLSRKEFVGADEQFKKIDADGDGFVSPVEARAADEWFRNEIPK